MDDYEISVVKGPHGKKRSKGRLWNILTILVLVMTLVIAAVFFLIYLNPNSILNPFPPPTYNPKNATPTPTVVPRNTLVPSWTPTIIVPSATDTPAPTHAPLALSTVVEKPTNIPQAVVADANEYAFVLQQGSPAAIDGAQFHPDTGCKWTGVAGQATSLNGEGVKGLFVQLGGASAGVKSVDNITMTGLAAQYGDGGFEITLSDHLFASSNTLWIQLLDQQNLPLSGRIYFNTYEECTKNLIIIYFDQVR